MALHPSCPVISPEDPNSGPPEREPEEGLVFSPQGSGPSNATSQLWDFGSEHLLFLNLSFPHL